MVKRVKTILPTGNRIKCHFPSFFSHLTPLFNSEKHFFYSKRNIRHNYLSLHFSFTLIEIMVTVVILTAGILFLYKGFFSSLNTSSYAEHYIYAQLWSDNKMEEVEHNLKRFKAWVFQTSGDFKSHNKKFIWNLTTSLMAATEKMDMYEVDLKVNWKEDKRNVKIEKTSYVCYRNE